MSTRGSVTVAGGGGAVQLWTPTPAAWAGASREGGGGDALELGGV